MNFILNHYWNLINKTKSQNNAGGLSYENQAFLVIGHQMFAVLIEDSHRGGVNKKPVRRP